MRKMEISSDSHCTNRIR